MRSWGKLALAIGVAGLLTASGTYAWIRHPAAFSARYNLKLATGPIASEGQRVLATFVREVATEHPIVHLVPVGTEDLTESGKLLMDGRVDVAVVRSDDEAAAHGRTLFVLRRIALAVLLPPGSAIESAGELSGKKIAVIKGFDPALLRIFSEFYGLRTADVIEVPQSIIGAALKDRRMAAAVVFGPLGPGSITDAAAGIRKQFKEDPTFLDLAEADAIAARWPAYESVEVKQGTFGGSPSAPTETIHTFAVTLRLVSRASLSDRAAGELTRLLLATKAKLVTTLPAAGQMEPPDTEKTALLPIHPGTLAYLKGEQESLLDQTLDYYWLAVMIFAVAAPLAGWIASRRGARRREEARAKLFRVVELMQIAKTGSADQLIAAEHDLEDMTEWLFKRLADGEIERDHFQCIERMISQLRTAIRERRSELAGQSGITAAA